MGELLKKPYEISVWEDELTQNGFIEKKIAIIGSDTMTGLNKVYDPVFNKKANGEKTLSFSLKYKYFDPYSENEEVINPFVGLLTNERKVKLKYDGRWYEFIVKDHTESSEEFSWDYTCTDAFVLELAKNGYNITFNADLNNNQGTARELAAETIKDTEWRLGDSNIGKQHIDEPLYKGEIDDSINVLNTDTNNIESVTGEVYVFYSYIKNKNGKYVQFIKRDGNYEVDDKNVIIATNYRILEDSEVSDTEIVTGAGATIEIGDIETLYQGSRLVYNQLTTYDPVMERTVDRYKAGDREIYKYTDYIYTTSNVLINFFTNGENFNVLEDGSLQGWNPYVETTGQTVKKLELKTRPELGTGKELANITALSQIEGFLKVEFNGTLTSNYQNAVYNSGIENNASFVESISKGQKFVFRWRAGQGEFPNLSPTQNIGLLVAKYEQDPPTRYGYYYKHIDRDNIILQFEGTPRILNNIIEGGSLVQNETGKYDYVIDTIVQTPSTKYVYVNSIDDRKYIWGGESGTFELLDENNYSNYLPYYYLVAEAQKSVPNSVIKDVTERIGIFIYSKSGTGPYYLQDVQLTRFVPDGSDPTGQTPMLMGNIPTAVSESTDYYYIKPADGAAAEDINTYATAEELKTAYGIDEEVVPLYNEGSEKNLSISASQSNCFDILQTIAETFECWIDLVVDHDDNGYIQCDGQGLLKKYVYLKEYAGEENWAGFKYGINLDTIERNINSDEVVTKLIVDQSQSDYVDEGFVSIASSSFNTSGESYILNFDYYYNQGLLNREEAETDRLNFASQIADLNIQIKNKEQQRRDLESSMLALGSKRNVYTELVNTAQETQSEALGEFENLTGKSYEDYREEHTTLEEVEQLTEEETILDVLGKLYVSSSTVNSYSGLLTNIEEEYWQVRKELRGSENYKVKIWTGHDNNGQRHVYVELNDYLPGFQFTLGDSTYESTVSRKYFDIEKDDTVITFTAPSGYEVKNAEDTEVTSYTINDLQTVTFKILSTESVEGVEDIIESLREQKDELTKAFNNKYSRFIQEGTWSSTDYIDSDIYYLDALQVSNTSAQPVVSYTINVVEISQLDGFEWYKFDAGDKTYIEDTEFFGWSSVNGILTPAREEVIVSEVEWHLDEPDKNTITVQNYKTRFEDFFQRISATVQTVQYNEATYAKISSIFDANGTLNQNVLLESLNRISGKQYSLTSDGSVLIDGDNILVQNLNNSANRVIINSEGIRVSSDGGESWTTAIDGQGINVGAVYTGSLNTNEIIIGNKDNPSFRWDKAGISAFGTANDGSYDLQTFVRYDQYGLYGIKDNGSFKAQNLDDVLEKAHFAVTWDGFFIKNSYAGGGQVEITTDNDFRVLKSGGIEKIKIGALEWEDADGETTTNPEDGVGAPTLYGIRIKNDAGAEVIKTGDDGNLEITGILNATGGNFSGTVNVGSENQDHIIIDGTNALIKTSTYQPGANWGWMINKDGDAVFNNITARGAIKTAVFEYAEIQSVGGVFIFRPSSTIRSAVIAENQTDLLLTVEKQVLFKEGQWCKISNYYSGDNPPDTVDPITDKLLQNNGLTHVYEITDITNGVITLEGAAAMIGDTQDAAVSSVEDLIGGALVDMGNSNGTSNYGIGINSSDNTVNLPARAISLFETTIDDSEDIKVAYNYRGILGTLPEMSSGVKTSVYDNMKGTQGIYTDNMYIGDEDQYIAFYTDGNNDKHLKISARDLVFEYDPTTGEETTWEDKIEEAAAGAGGMTLVLSSTIGEQLIDGVGEGAVYARMFTGAEEVDPLKTTVFSDTPPTTGDYYYHLDSTNYTCTLKKKVNNEWVNAPTEDQPIYTYTWTFRDGSGTPIDYGSTASIVGKAIYMDSNIVNGKIIVECTVDDGN